MLLMRRNGCAKASVPHTYNISSDKKTARIKKTSLSRSPHASHAAAAAKASSSHSRTSSSPFIFFVLVRAVFFGGGEEINVWM
jgi:hypothetical protein